MPNAWKKEGNTYFYRYRLNGRERWAVDYLPGFDAQGNYIPPRSYSVSTRKPRERKPECVQRELEAHIRKREREKRRRSRHEIDVAVWRSKRAEKAIARGDRDALISLLAELQPPTDSPVSYV